MPNIQPLHNVNHVFRNIGGVIPDAFEIFGHQDQLEGGKNYSGIAHHIRQQFAKDLVAQAIYFVVPQEHVFGEFGVAPTTAFRESRTSSSANSLMRGRST